MSCPDPTEVAFKLPVNRRTTFSAFPYFKNDAATRKYLNVLLSGEPNFPTNSFSELIVLISSTGPQLNAPANPPILVDTAGTTFVASISLISTPGDTKNAIALSSILLS